MDGEWKDSQPIYRQLRDRVVAMILDGVLSEGDALPSVRGFSRGMAFNLLLRDGVVNATVESLQRGAPRLDRGALLRRAGEDA